MSDNPEHVPEPETWTRLAPGGVADRNDEPAMEQAKKALHDRVVEDLGMSRTSGVTWLVFDADDGAIDALRKYFPDDDMDTEHRKNRDGLISYLEENPGGALIIATAEAKGTPRSMDLPFELTPGGPVSYNTGAQDVHLASGLAILSATGDSPLPGSEHERIPIVIFRFQHPEGDAYEDIVLVMDPDQLQKLPDLVAHNVQSAIGIAALETALRKKGNENGTGPGTSR